MDIEATVTELLSNLIAIPSVNPFYGKYGGLDSRQYGERRVAEFIADVMNRSGFEVSMKFVTAERPNVIIRLPGVDGSRRLLLETHMDTVSVESMAIQPFSPSISEGKVWGRGACDAKGSLASMMTAMLLLRKQGTTPPIDTYLVAVVDEEHAFTGVQALVHSGLKADAAIVGEPTNLRIAISQKGTVRFSIETRGRSCHTSEPDKGENAILLMAELVCALQLELNSLSNRRIHPLVGRPTFTVSTIRGGTGVNTVPGKCEVDIDMRIVPGQTPECALNEVCKAVQNITTGWNWNSVVVHDPFHADLPMETEETTAIAMCLQRAVRNHGLSYPLVGLPCGTDANKLVGAGIPAVVFGPGSLNQAHSDNEFVEIEQLATAVHILAEAIASFDPLDGHISYSCQA